MGPRFGLVIWAHGPGPGGPSLPSAPKAAGHEPNHPASLMLIEEGWEAVHEGQ